ncbi:hypothetical protein [Hymenobacter negativus]|uniref:DNA-directed DNA polymerase family A palm domain-containing protein n=1 Tax=Hymenobacter negativus TaxID=2795026 RepID=A0ABS0Q258_9BACT|nr:hypothetical protein [Hymenobacter negativus]MBH8556724.1 hypothetical protein [Hymenobacter negativus]
MPRPCNSQKVEINLFHPANLNLNELNTTLTGLRNIPALKKGIILINTYIIKKTFGRTENTFGNAYIPVHSDIFRRFIGDDYPQVVERLITNRLLERLECDEHGNGRGILADGRTVDYSKGYYQKPSADCSFQGQSKSYRIPNHLYGKDIKFIRQKETVTKRGTQKLNAVNHRTKGITEKYREYVRSMMRTVVILDSVLSRAAIEALWAENSVRLTAEDFIDIFNHSPFNETVVDFFGNRVFSQVVYSPKSIREFYRFRDDLDSPIVELDIVNSQPAIFASLSANLIMRFAPECDEAIPYFEAVANCEDYQFFQQLCFDGTIYETISDRFNRMYGEKLMMPLSRKDAKTVFYTAAYSDYEYLDSLNIHEVQHKLNSSLAYGVETDIEKYQKQLHSVRSFEVFKSLFPSVHRLFTQLKTLNWPHLCAKQYANNCLLAQRVESSLIFTVLVKALVNAGIEKVVTIHDAIFLREQDEAQAREIIQTELSNLNLKLKLKPARHK